jgi:NADH-quinone oxidoreductase subunit M
MNEATLGNLHILSIVTWLPAAGAIILLFFKKEKTQSIKLFANFWAAICFLVSIPLLVAFEIGRPGFQFIENHHWIPSIGVKYQLGIDGLALVLVMLTTLLGWISTLCSWNYIKQREKEYYVFLLLLQTGMLGVFVALDLFLFYVFWEVMLVPMYFLIGIWGGENRLYAAIKFFLYTLVGSVVMLLAILKLYFMLPELVAAHQNELMAWLQQFGDGKTASMITDAANRALASAPGAFSSSFNIPILHGVGQFIPLNTQIWLWAAFFLGFAIKVPMFPFHTWLPDAHVEAPTAGSVILAGVLLKMGTYGFLRFNLPILPQASQDSRVLSVAVPLAIIGIIYGALLSMYFVYVSRDMKKLVAYSSVSHMGAIMLGIFAMNPHGINGAIVQMINHGISTSALFLIVGVLYERRHTRTISEYGGISHVMPVFATVFLIMTMSSIGLPLLNGFIGEFLILWGAFERNIWWGVFAVTGIVLGAGYMLWLYQKTMFGKVTNPENENLPDLDWREITYFSPLIVLAFAIGIFPQQVILKYIQPPTVYIVRQVNPSYAQPQQLPQRVSAQPESVPPPVASPPVQVSAGVTETQMSESSAAPMAQSSVSPTPIPAVKQAQSQPGVVTPVPENMRRAMTREEMMRNLPPEIRDSILRQAGQAAGTTKPTPKP